MKQIGQILHHKNYPLIILEANGHRTYYESLSGYWAIRKFNSSGEVIKFRNSVQYLQQQDKVI